MFELAQFYSYCRQNDVDIIPYAGIPAPGATLRDGEHYAVFLDFTQIRTTRQFRGVCAHELSHLSTGALHRPASPYDLAARNEYRANRHFAQQYLSVKELREAFRLGFRELWELAEYFDLPEQDIEKALQYWTVSRNIDFHAIDNGQLTMDN